MGVSLVRPLHLLPGSSLPQRLGDGGLPFPIASQRRGSCILGKDFWVAEDTSQRDRERVYLCKFSKVNTSKKKEARACHQVLAGRPSVFFGRR